MRLGALLLIPAALAAAPLPASGRGPGTAGLPWERAAPLAWQAEPWVAPAAVAGSRSLPGAHDRASTGDGTLRISDARGLIRLLAGLPGGPCGPGGTAGVPLDAAWGTWGFPTGYPPGPGPGGAPLGRRRFPPLPQGLLWVLEDGEGFLTVVHPATARLVHLPLPPGRDLRIRFLPDRLEVAAGDVEEGAPRRGPFPGWACCPAWRPWGPAPTPPRRGPPSPPSPKTED